MKECKDTKKEKFRFCGNSPEEEKEEKMNDKETYKYLQ